MHRVLESLKNVSRIADDILVYRCGETMDEALRNHDSMILWNTHQGQ